MDTVIKLNANIQHPHAGFAEDAVALPLCEYRFTFQALGDIKFPAYEGKLWHSVFGNALRQNVCVTPQNKCERCMLLHDCAYTLLFHGPRPPQSEKMRRYNTIPVPHVLRHRYHDATSIKNKQTFSVDMVLVGRANSELVRVIQAMQKAGQHGIGPERTQAQLLQVEQLQPQGLNQLIMSEGQMHCGVVTPQTPRLPECPQRLKIQWRAPYKQSNQYEENKNFSLSKMLMATVRRVSLLSYFYTDKALECDFKALKEQAGEVQAQAINVHMHSDRRYSASSQTSFNIQGWLGSIDLAREDIHAFYPYLYLSQWLNIGKNASMGYGQYRLLALT